MDKRKELLHKVCKVISIPNQQPAVIDRALALWQDAHVKLINERPPQKENVTMKLKRSPMLSLKRTRTAPPERKTAPSQPMPQRPVQDMSPPKPPAAPVNLGCEGFQNAARRCGVDLEKLPPGTDLTKMNVQQMKALAFSQLQESIAPVKEAHAKCYRKTIVPINLHDDSSTYPRAY